VGVPADGKGAGKKSGLVGTQGRPSPLRKKDCFGPLNKTALDIKQGRERHRRKRPKGRLRLRFTGGEDRTYQTEYLRENDGQPAHPKRKAKARVAYHSKGWEGVSNEGLEHRGPL